MTEHAAGAVTADTIIDDVIFATSDDRMLRPADLVRLRQQDLAEHHREDLVLILDVVEALHAERLRPAISANFEVDDDVLADYPDFSAMYSAQSEPQGFALTR